jgi:two-component system, OmpR family, sensor histidine kinase KdpD
VAAFPIGLAVGALVAVVAVWWWMGRRGDDATTGPADPVLQRAELVSKISHELKNPIMSVKGLASTGNRLYGSLSDEERQDLFRLIDAEASRLKLIADETSTTLKIDAGTLAYDPREEDVARLVEEAVWRTPVADHPIHVEAAGELVARVDRMRLAEAIANLVDNAVKFSPTDAPILVRANRVDDGIVIDVRDAGPGIPDERKPLAFERYGAWRPRGYEEVPGAGLGLYITRAHVEAHGGRLDIVDAEPRGTILRVWLPSRG